MASCKTVFLCILNKYIILYLPCSSRAWNQTVYVDLWDTEGDEEIHINKVLIEKGFAHETDHAVSNPWNIEGSVEVNPHKTVGLPGWNNCRVCFFGHGTIPGEISHSDVPAISATIPVALLDIFSRQWYWGILLWDTNTTYCVTWWYTHARWFICVTHAAVRY